MKSRKGGFTLSELLTVVAILAVLLAVAIPAVVSIRANLKMRELDDTAREIFLAAQNSLTSRKAAGVPLSAGDPDTEGTKLYWLSSSDSEDMKRLLSTGAIEGVAAGNHYMIWYDAASATVLEVYYAEDFLPADVQTGKYSDSYSGGNAKEARREAKIGYYSGKGAAQPDIKPLLPPTVVIENKEDLTAVITLPAGKVGEYAAAGVTLTVTVDELGPDGKPAGRRYTFPETATKYSVTTGEAKLILDSLTGGHFQDICLDITPGANIRVTATLNGNGYLSSSAYDEDNSLFAKRETVKDGAEEKDVLSIACPRHLQNLERDVSGLPAEAGNNYYAVQTREITWQADGPQFQPIGNLGLRGYDGNGNEIKNLRVDCGKAKGPAAGAAAGFGAGLFAFVENGVLQNIRLSDPVLTGAAENAAQYVGALAGILHRSKVANCQVYATVPTEGAVPAAGIDCGGHAGGLIGLAVDGYTIEKSSASLPRIKSSLDGAYIGGLIGYASVHSGYGDGRFSQCYADTGLMGSNKKWDSAYGMVGNGTAVIGGLIGGTFNENGTDGTNYISDCYAVGWFSGGGSGSGRLVGTNVKGTPVVSNYYNILQNAAGNHYYVKAGNFGSEETRIGALSELKKFGGTNWTANGAATPYNSAVCPAPYPYPRLSLRHYGDWPVQTVDGVRLFDGNTSGSQELQFIIVPAHTGTVEFWAQAQNGGSRAMQAVTAAGEGAGITAATTGGYDAATGRTKVTLTFQNTPGVTYVDLRAEDYTLRAVVVLYQAKVTLKGKNTGASANLDPPEPGAASSGGEYKMGALDLNSEAKTGEFTAAVEVAPLLAQIGSRVDGWQNKPSAIAGQYGVSATRDDVEAAFADEGWEECRTDPENAAKHDPAVTANGDPANGTNILQPVDGDYYPGSASGGGPLTVTGVASGTATVSARWAWDETVKADCEVKMKGARALIEIVEAKGTASEWAEKKGGYPYRLDLIAQPDEDIILTFIPRLFAATKDADGNPLGEYTWEITRNGQEGPAAIKAASISSDPKVDGGKWSCTLKDHEPNATYTVTLTYVVKDAGGATAERSVDFMTFSVYRAAKKTTEENYKHIEIAKVDGDGTFSGTAAAVEQITSNDYPNVDKLTLQGWVDGAGNTQVKWSFSTDGGDSWTDITGHNGPISVFETTETGKRIRATVEWLPDQQEYGGSKIATGGAIKIVGQDANEFDEPFAFKLKAEAVEATDTPGAVAASKTVAVTVLQRLQIDPQSKTLRYFSWFGTGPRDWEFKANRTENKPGYGYKWYVDGAELTNANGSQTTVEGKQGMQQIALYYGPHKASAVLTNVYVLEGFSYSINWDIGDDSGNQYFLVEKGVSRSLEFSWGAPVFSYAKIKKHPVNNTVVSIETTSTASSDAQEGFHDYSVTGLNFTTNNAPAEMSWLIDRNWPLKEETAGPFYIHIIGMDVKQGDAVVSDVGEVTMTGPNTTVDLTADWSFPSDLIKPDSNNEKKPAITWKISDPELVSFVDGSGNDLGTEVSGADLTNVTLKAHKYSADDYTVTLQATCKLTAINGREYTFTKLMQVTVKQDLPLNVDLQLCTSADLAGLQAAFPGADLTENSLLAAVDQGENPVLVYDPDFGCDAMYLKVSATLEGRTEEENLSQYLCNIYANEFYAKVETALSEDKQTVYIKVTAEEANKDKYVLPLHVAIGSAERILNIDLYNAPTVKLTWKNSEGEYVDVTNGSYPISSAAILPTTLNAELVPALHSYGDSAKTPLDSIAWEMRPPADGYVPSRYLEMTAGVPTVDAAAGEVKYPVTVSLLDQTRMPDFRVELRAYSRKSGAAYAGYALVFLPEDPAATP